MRSYLFALTAVLFITNCATYSPVQHIGGERPQSATAIESCTFEILTFPVDPESTSIAGGMRALDINASQVYSIENKQWMYLWPLLAHKCVYFQMNSKYTAKVDPTSQKNTGSSTAPVIMQTPATPDTATPTEALVGQITGDMDADFTACDDLMRMERSQCRKKVYNHYRNLEKKKK